MYMRELDTFIAVAERGSFLKAADVLFVTPASVMNQMNKLEGIAGVKLIERTNHGAVLTAAGQSLYRDAKQMIEFSAASLQRAQQAAEQEHNVIRIGTSILRPCQRLVDLWARIDDGKQPFQLQIVPFDDEPKNLRSVLANLGAQIDCIVSPCDSLQWQTSHSISIIGSLPCRIALARRHRLAAREKLKWNDLEGETFMLMQHGDSPVLNDMRAEITAHHPSISIEDIPDKYDPLVFNKCEQMGCVMESLDIWSAIHPSLVTLPMDWEYEMPYGIIYAKAPSKAVQDFIGIIESALDAQT